MNPIDIDGRTVRVDVDARTPIPQIAHWLKDANPSREKIELLLQGITAVATTICDTVAWVAEGLHFVFELLAYYCQGYTITPTKYASASGHGAGVGEGSLSINS